MSGKTPSSNNGNAATLRKPAIVSTPTRRTKTATKPISRPSTAPVAMARKLPFQQKPELGHNHNRSIDSGLTRSIPPLRASTAHAEMNGLETTSQGILNEQLVRLTTLLLRSHSVKTSHDSSAVRDHAYQRAHEVVDEELSRIITRLINLQGPSPMHRIVALSQLSTSLTRDIEKAIFTDDRAYLANFANEQRVRQEESSIAHAAFAHELATKDQQLASLVADKAELERASVALVRKCEALEKELEKAARNQAQTHQNAVELRMQGLDFKARVDNRCARILASIQSRMGFIPAGIQKQVLYLKVLKAPGDPAYDEMRMHTHQRMARKRFDSAGDKRPPRGRPIGVSPWISKALSDTQPPFAQFSAREETRRSLQSVDSEEVEMQDLARPPRSQADWVRWAMNKASGDNLLGHTSTQGSSDGGMNFGYGTFSGDDGDGDGDAQYHPAPDDDDGDAEYGADSESDDGAVASASDYIFARHRAGSASLIGDA